MKNKLKIMAGAVAALMSCSSVVQATPIAGSIGFTGTFIQSGGTLGDLTTATSMSIKSAAVGTTTGNFVGASLISFASPIAVNPGAGLSTLWTVLVGGITYAFNSTSESQNLTTPTALHLLGTGTITDGTAADATTGTWQLGFGKSGDSFEWQSTSAADVGGVTSNTVPDGGSTVMLLGAGLSGICLFRKKAVA
jgi:VPDSG-CTERM motif